jgi:hypothetical protein
VFVVAQFSEAKMTPKRQFRGIFMTRTADETAAAKSINT